MRVLGVSGSLRRGSYNTALLRYAGDLLEAEGAEFELYDGLREIPPYDEDDDTSDAPEAVTRMRRAVLDADALLFVTPEYNSSIPGALKNALDWISRPFATNALRFKPVAVIGASVTDYGAMWAQDHLRKALGIAGARVLDSELAVSRAHERFDDEGRLVDEATGSRLAELLDELIAACDALARAA